MTRYSPSRQYLVAGMAALALAAFSGWCASRWPPASVAAVLFVVSGLLVLLLAFQPPVEIHETHLAIGRRRVQWNDIRRLDRTGWVSPLVLHITLADDRRVLLVYPGDLDSSNSLLRNLRRHARNALIDGIPYRQFWGENQPVAAERKQMPSPKYQILRPEDEADVERMFQRLKTVGHLDPKSDEK